MRIDIVRSRSRAHATVERVVAPTPRDELLLALRMGTRARNAEPARSSASRSRTSPSDATRCARWPRTCCVRRSSCRATPHVGAPVRPLAWQAPGRRSSWPRRRLAWIALAQADLDRARRCGAVSLAVRAGRVDRARGLRARVDRRKPRARDVGRRRWPTMHGVAPAIAIAHARGAARGVVLGRAQSPREWVTQWRMLLVARGWPGAAPLAGAQFEAQQAFDRLLEDFARVGTSSAARAARGTRRVARRRARNTIFQPQGPRRAPIVIMGLLEAASVTFDALWVAGLSGRSDGRPRRSPIPVAAGVAARARRAALERGARALLRARADRAARSLRADVVMSAPAVMRRLPTRPVAARRGDAWPADDANPLADDSVTRIAACESRSSRCATIARRRSHRGGAPAGAGAIAAQSDCPFKAMAQYRLRVEPWPDAAEGLSAERARPARARDDGDVLDESFGRTTRSSRSTRHALRERIDAAAAGGAATDPARRAGSAAAASSRPPRRCGCRRSRRTGSRAFERPRPPFTVSRTEAQGHRRAGRPHVSPEARSRGRVCPTAAARSSTTRRASSIPTRTWFTPSTALAAARRVPTSRSQARDAAGRRQRRRLWAAQGR